MNDKSPATVFGSWPNAKKMRKGRKLDELLCLEIIS
jgi:hypothetical protein